MTDFRAFFTKLAPVTKRLQLDPYYKGQTTSLGVYFDTMNKTENVKKILVKLFATGVISILLMFMAKDLEKGHSIVAILLHK